MKKYDNVYIVDYWDLELDYFKKIDRNFRIMTDILDDCSVKNDTIYNIYPHEIKAFDLTNKDETELAYAFINWFAIKHLKDYEYFSDFYDNDYHREELVLKWLCTLGEIEEGNYLIRISW